MAAIKTARVVKLTGSVCDKFTVAVALALSVQVSSQVCAADFSNAKRVYVPASLIERRIDYSLVGGQPPATVNYTRPSTSTAAPRIMRYVQVNGSGYVPPAPSIAQPAPTSLPSALKATVLPSRSVPALPTQASVPPQVGHAISKAKDFTDKHRASITSSASQLKARAQQLMQDGRIEDARKLLFSAATITPADRKMLADFAANSVEKAKALIVAQDYDSASRVARQALSAEPGNLAASQLLDESLTKLGVNFNDAGARIKMAHTFYDQGRYDEAAVEYRTSLKIKPSADAHIGLGNIASRSSQKATAKQEYREALHIDPNSSAAHRQLGIAQYNDGDLVAASANLSKALGLDPKDKLAGKTLVELWQRQLSRLPTANSHLGLARAYQLSGDLASAQAEYKEVVRLDPNNSNLPAARHSFKLALARQQAENSVQAARTLEANGALRDAYKKVYEAVSWNPADASLRFYQGQLLEKLGQVPQAREAYMHVLRIQPTNAAAAARLKDLPLEVAPGMVTSQSQPLVAPLATIASAAPSFGAPISSDAHVGALSGFALQMREHMLAEKDRMQQIENVAQSLLKGGKSKPGGIDELLASIPAAAGTVSAAPVAAAPGAAAPVASADATGSAGLIAPLSATANTAQSLVGLTSSIAEFLKGGSTGGVTAPAATAGSAPIATTAAAPAAPAMPLDVLQKMPKVKSAYQRLLALEEQNKKLKDQLTKMRGVAPATEPAAPIAAATAATPSAIATTAVASAAPFAGQFPLGSSAAITPSSVSSLPAASAFGTPQYQQFDSGNVAELSAPPAMAMSNNFSPNMVPGILNQAINGAPQVAPDFRRFQSAPMQQPAIQSLPEVPSSVAVPTQTAGAAVAPSQVRFELVGIETGFTGVRLAVVLKNNSDVAITVPQEMKAVIRYRDSREATVKVVFGGTSVAPHGQIAGSIKVPLDKVDPTADLVLPNLLPTATGDAEVHLTMQATPKAL